MTKSTVIIVVALFAVTSAAGNGKCIGGVVVEPVHPGTAILDSLGIFAGVEAPVDGSVHPGTAILDSIGIFAGEPAPAPTVAGNGCLAPDLPQHGG